MEPLLIDIRKDSLINVLQLVLKAVSHNNLIPVLAGICIEVHTTEIVFTTSNTSMTIQYRVSQDSDSLIIYRTGGIVVPARYFIEVIRKLNEGLIIFEVNQGLILTIISGSSQIRLQGMDPGEFPSINKDYPMNAKFRINNSLLKSTIRQVAIAASSSEARPVLTGVSFDYNNDYLRLVVTDGIRLASRTIYTENNWNNNTKILIPAQNLYEISKLLKNDDDTTEIVTFANQVRFTTNELKIDSVLIDGVFPSIMNIIPKGYISEVLLESNLLLRAVECVSVLAGESIIKLATTTCALALFSQTADIGEIQNEIPLIEMEGEDFNISLNGKLLVDLLRSIESEKIRIRFTGKVSPIILIPEDIDSSTLFLITPVRTHN
ncbi:DNA polymerase III subunit beta [Paenibacillus solani]|uniref:DNA polymerase III subunit beta n=1 Tax=Paenibacillus solani TaxID=1705565 RepID=UPI003D2A8A82